MLIYYLVFFVVWTSAFLTYLVKINRLHKEVVSASCVIACFLFVAFRYHTGYDWPKYVLIWEQAPTLGPRFLESCRSISVHHGEEFFYILTNGILKSVYPDFLILQVLASAILFGSLMAFLRHTTKHYLFVFAITYSWLFRSVFFSVIRQSMAIGFFLLFIVLLQKRRHVLALIVLLLAIFMHYSSCLYFFLYALAFLPFGHRTRALLWWSSCGFLVLGALGASLSWVQGTTGSLISSGILAHLPPMIATKMRFYILEKVAGASDLDIAFVVFTMFAVGGCLVVEKNRYRPRTLGYVLLNWCVLFLLFQAIFFPFQTIRNRMTYVGIIFVSVIVLGALDRVAKHSVLIRSSVFFFSSVSMFFVLTLFFLSPISLPFVPYYTYFTKDVVSIQDDSYHRTRRFIRYLRH